MVSSNFGLEPQSQKHLILLLRLFSQTPLAFVCILEEQIVDAGEKQEEIRSNPE